MKRWLCAILVLLLLSAANAEEAIHAEGVTQLLRDEVYQLDLDGDGSEETVQIRMQNMGGEENLQLLVETSELIYTYDTYILYEETAYAADLDGDGTREILLCGDEASSDFYTWCLKFDRERGIQPLKFADAERGENTGDYRDCGFGRLDAIEGNVLTMSGSQDVLGTWWCSREFTLRDGQFELDDGGVWKVIDETENPEIWEYHCLTLVRNLDVTMEDGSEATLSAGVQFVLTETDKVSFVGFQTRDGRRGRFSIEPDVAAGWGSLIDGVSESEYFDFLPYAD